MAALHVDVVRHKLLVVGRRSTCQPHDSHQCGVQRLLRIRDVAQSQMHSPNVVQHQGVVGIQLQHPLQDALRSPEVPHVEVREAQGIHEVHRARDLVLLLRSRSANAQLLLKHLSEELSSFVEASSTDQRKASLTAQRPKLRKPHSRAVVQQRLCTGEELLRSITVRHGELKMAQLAEPGRSAFCCYRTLCHAFLDGRVKNLFGPLGSEGIPHKVSCPGQHHGKPGKPAARRLLRPGLQFSGLRRARVDLEGRGQQHLLTNGLRSPGC
mmetsp:Transcript_36683/g.65191  ORF Transcript_36683/g.65191 Transcript_36683/m.65191 type:complete len:268 (+) Transcript_36683:356-1159(+)